MKKAFLIISLFLNLILLVALAFNKQSNNIKDHLDFSRYISENNKIKVTKDSTIKQVLFLGNSITANWINLSQAFFADNKFLNRGVGGQTSTQMLLRFQQDVVALGVKKVILNTGINDIGEGDGFYDLRLTIQNIQSMIDIAKQNDIELILSSVLPATDICVNRWMKISNVQEKIGLLNKEIITLASDNNLKYIDYNSKLRNTDGTFNDLYTFDGVHPNLEGYKIMEALVLEYIN